MRDETEAPCKSEQHGNPQNTARVLIHGMQDFSKLWELAFNASSDMITILDVHHNIVAVNTAASEVMECAPQAAIGQKCHRLIHQTEEPPQTCPHRALLEDGKSHQNEFYEEWLNLWLQVNATPLYDTNHQLCGSIHIARDITAQKRTEQARRESEERYHHLSDATTDGVLLTEESVIIATNQVLAEMLGYSTREMVGMNLLKFVAPQDRNRLIQTIRNPMTDMDNFVCIRKDGTTFPIEAHSRAITYKEKMVYQTAIRDLTEQKQMEAQKIAHERLRGVIEMAGAVSHEINQPLMALQGFMELLTANPETTEGISRNVHEMQKQIERIKKLTHKIMHITTYETKDYAGGKKIIDLDQAARGRNWLTGKMDSNDDEY